MPNGFNRRSQQNVFAPPNTFGGQFGNQGFNRGFGGFDPFQNVGQGGQEGFFGLNLPQTFAIGQGIGLVGDIFSNVLGGRNRRIEEAETGVETALTGLQDVAGQQPFDPFQVASFAAQPVRQEAERRGEFLQEVSGNVFAPDVQGALFEEFAPQFGAIFGGAAQRAGEITQQNKLQAALARLQARLQGQQLAFQ